MQDKRFILTPAERCPITILEDVTLLRLPLGERVPHKTLKKRAKIAKNARIATHASPNVGDMHAPFDAVIKDVTPTFIELEHAPLPPDAPATPNVSAEAAPKTAPEEDDNPAAPVAPVSLEGLSSLELGQKLKRLGVSIRPFTRPCDILIVNALNPEPGMLYTEELLREHMPALEAGFALLRALNDAPRRILAVPQGVSAQLPGAETRSVRPVYPVSLARPMIRAITGKEETKRVTLVRLHNLFQLGLVAQSGLPLTRSLVTAFGSNFIAPLGTPVSTFLERAGLAPNPGDSIILGGAMRGIAISGLRRGLRKVDDAMQLVRQGSRPELGDNPCINCGACVSVCPMRLRPNMLSRYAEFEQYESCRKEYIETCIECGMCGWVCPSCRPMQQHFRMAKSHLGLSTYQHRLRG